MPTLLKLFLLLVWFDQQYCCKNIFAGKEVATSAVEHPSVLESLKARASSAKIVKLTQPLRFRLI